MYEITMLCVYLSDFEPLYRYDIIIGYTIVPI
jgi:hypothetical protein